MGATTRGGGGPKLKSGGLGSGKMHHKLARTKGFGRTITIHDNQPPSPPQTTPATFHAVPFATHGHPQKADGNNSDMDSLINTTCFNKMTESANYPVTSQSTERGKLVGRGQFRLLVIQKWEELMEWRGGGMYISCLCLR